MRRSKPYIFVTVLTLCSGLRSLTLTATASEQDEQATKTEWVRCLKVAAGRLDDTTSDAATVAVAVSGACRQQFLASLDATARNMNRYARNLFIQKAEASNIEMKLAISAVLNVRARKNTASHTLASPLDEDNSDLTTTQLQNATSAMNRSDYPAALALFRLLAERGNVEGQAMLGLLYLTGKGVAKDDREAAIWTRKAAEQGYLGAQITLGTLYENGRGVPQDFFEAINWFKKAARMGSAEAQRNLGYVYAAGGPDFPKDEVAAVKWFRAAADQGDPEGQRDLGVQYWMGHGVPQDLREAAKWFRLAAGRGDADAQSYLSTLYSSHPELPQ